MIYTCFKMNDLSKLNRNIICLPYFTPFCNKRTFPTYRGILVSPCNALIASQKLLTSGFSSQKIIPKEIHPMCSYESCLLSNVRFSSDLFYLNDSHNTILLSKYAILSGNLRSLRHYSSNSKDNTKDLNVPNSTQSNSAEPNNSKLSQKDRLKRTVRDYGSTVVVFHVGISLTSLGICYFLISNGLDAAFVLKAVGFSESVISSKVAVGSSTFVIAYAVHKMFAPVRIAITLSATPFIVRYLRKIGFLKPPKSLKPSK